MKSGEKVGENAKGIVGLSPGIDPKAVLFARGNDIFVNTAKEGGISDFLDNSDNIKNILIHEITHLKQYESREKSSTPKREIDAILSQMGHESYIKTTDALQTNAMMKLKEYLETRYTEEKKPFSVIERAIIQANEKNLTYQIKAREGMSGINIQVTKKSKK